MSGPTPSLTEDILAPASTASESTFADRVDILYRLGRHYLFLPFSALCVVGVLYQGIVPLWYASIPLLLQIAATVATGRLTSAYMRRPANDDIRKWANRYVMMSAVAGATWGVGALIWFEWNSFPSQAFLAVAFLGMTAVEFIARCVQRLAYIAHATFSLGPLAVILALQGGTYPLMASMLVLFFGAVLFSYCDAVAGILDESIRLRRDNAALVVSLSAEKTAAETARDQAQASVRAKSAFIANISHELRTPLNALLGMGQLLERSELSQAQKSHVKVLLEAGRGLKTLLDDVIALSRDEGEYEMGAEEDCDAAQAVRTVARLLQPRAWEKQLRITVSADSNLPRVAADPRRVRRVLLKLADNAVKFTDRGGVEIAVAPRIRDDGMAFLRFTVTDTGLGLAPEMKKHLFEPFAQTDISYARHNMGAGLGLAVAKRTIESLGGEIGFVSEPGEGSTFWFTVPGVRAACAEHPETQAIAPDAPPPWNLVFLVCAADDSLRLQLVNMLEPFGNRLTFTASAIEAVSNAGQGEYDAIVCTAADADSIAVAPSVRAPLLALILPGMRTPAGAGQVLRWPAPAGALYAALRDLLGRATDATAPKDDLQMETIAAIDAPAFAALEKSLGFTTLIEILQSYVKTAEDLCNRLADSSQRESWDEAARIAQDIAGAAGGLGLAALTAAARGFTHKARDHESAHELRNAAQIVVGEHERVRRALTNLYPDLAA